MKVQLVKYSDLPNEEQRKYDEYANCIRVRFEDVDDPTIMSFDQGDWIDAKLAEDVNLRAGEFMHASIGFAMAIPKNYEAWLVPRSSTFKHYGVIQTNGIGIIDNSYNGNSDIWKIPIYATRDITIPKGTRICQFRLVRTMDSYSHHRCDDKCIMDLHTDNNGAIVILVVDDLGNSDRGGFGSTGE